MKFRYWRFLMTLLGTFFLSLLAMAGVNAFFDPLHILRPPQQADIYDTESRFAIPGIIRHTQTPHMVVGTSIVKNFDELYYKQKTGAELTRVLLTGGTAYEMRRMAETLLSGPKRPKTIIWAIDPATYFAPELNSLRWTQFPEHLFQPEPSIARYIFSFQTFYRLLRQMPARINNETQKPNERFAFLAGDQPLGREFIYQSYCGEKKQQRITRLQEFKPEMMNDQLEHNLLPLIKSHPDQKFILFFPPYSLIQNSEFDAAGILNDVLKFHALLAEKLQAYPNVTLYDFSADETLITNYQDFSDSVHYGPSTNHRIIDKIAASQNKIIGADTSKNAQALKALVEKNKDALWAKIEAFCTQAGTPITKN